MVEYWDAVDHDVDVDELNAQTVYCHVCGENVVLYDGEVGCMDADCPHEQVFDVRGD